MAEPGPLRVGVIGGGIGGLTFAHLVQQSTLSKDVNVVIWERDMKDVRTQGYNLGINGASLTILAPLLHAGALPSLVHDMAHNRPARMGLRNAAGQPLMAFPGDGCFVDRRLFHGELAAGVDIQHGKCFASLSAGSSPCGGSSESGVTVRFTDGSETTVDLVVAADGANSAVRRQLYPCVTPRDMAVTNVAGTAPFSAIPPSIQHALRESRMARWLGRDGHSVMMFPYHPPPPPLQKDEAAAAAACTANNGSFRVSDSSGGGSSYIASGSSSSGSSSPSSCALWVYSYPGQRAAWEGKYLGREEDPLDEYGASALYARAMLLGDTCAQARSYFPPDVIGTMEATRQHSGDAGLCSLFGPRQIYSLDADSVVSMAMTGPSSPTAAGSIGADAQGASSAAAARVRDRVLLIGDAAHATTTHRGLGANTAIRDAADLVAALERIVALRKSSLPSPDPSAAATAEKAVSEILRAYQRNVLQRGADVVRQSCSMTGNIHNSGALSRYISEWVMWLVGFLVGRE